MSGKGDGKAAAADDRVMKDVVAPPRYRLTRQKLFPGNAKVAVQGKMRMYFFCF
jgi:hypothetical protein